MPIILQKADTHKHGCEIFTIRDAKFFMSVLCVNSLNGFQANFFSSLFVWHFACVYQTLCDKKLLKLLNCLNLLCVFCLKDLAAWEECFQTSMKWSDK